MSNLYIRVKTGFYTNRKTARLRAAIGDDAYWIPPRLWAYCAENQPDGNLTGYSSNELAELLGCQKYATSILDALLQAGFLDANLMLHDWSEHNGYHETYSKRAKTAAAARWGKKTQEIPPTPPKEETGNRKQEIGEKHCISNATSIKPEMTRRLNSMFSRNSDFPWSYIEESTLSEISKRPDALNELGILESFQAKAPQFPSFPGSISRLLTDWNETLDRARTYVQPINGHTGSRPNPRNEGIGIAPAKQSSAIVETLKRREREREQPQAA